MVHHIQEQLAALERVVTASMDYYLHTQYIDSVPEEERTRIEAAYTGAITHLQEVSQRMVMISHPVQAIGAE